MTIPGQRRPSPVATAATLPLWRAQISAYLACARLRRLAGSGRGAFADAVAARLPELLRDARDLHRQTSAVSSLLSAAPLESAPGGRGAAPVLVDAALAGVSQQVAVLLSRVPETASPDLAVLLDKLQVQLDGLNAAGESLAHVLSGQPAPAASDGAAR
jgi:hypothetical protein